MGRPTGILRKCGMCGIKDLPEGKWIVHCFTNKHILSVIEAKYFCSGCFNCFRGHKSFTAHAEKCEQYRESFIENVCKIIPKKEINIHDAFIFLYKYFTGKDILEIQTIDQPVKTNNKSNVKKNNVKIIELENENIKLKEELNLLNELKLKENENIKLKEELKLLNELKENENIKFKEDLKLLNELREKNINLDKENSVRKREIQLHNKFSKKNALLHDKLENLYSEQLDKGEQISTKSKNDVINFVINN